MSATILYLDDERENLEAIGGLLEEEGYVVIPAERPTHAYELLESHSIDLVISDVRMDPDDNFADGIAFLRTVQQEYPEVNLVVFTAYGDAHAQKFAMEVGGPVKVSKADPDQLLMVIRRELEWRNSIATSFEAHAIGKRAIREMSPHAVVNTTLTSIRLLTGVQDACMVLTASLAGMSSGTGGDNNSGERPLWDPSRVLRVVETGEGEVCIKRGHRTYYYPVGTDMVFATIVVRAGSVLPCNSLVQIELLVQQSSARIDLLRAYEDLKEPQNTMIAAERLKGALEMAGAACHELNQPLQACLSASELMQVHLERGASADREKMKALVLSVIGELERMGSITRRIQEVSYYKTKPYINGDIFDIGDSG